MLIEAVKVVLLGMTIVFIVLSLLGTMLYLIGKITSKVSKSSTLDGSGGVQNDSQKSDYSVSSNDCGELLRGENSSDLSDDAFIVAAVAACHYVKNQRYAIKKEREFSAWLLLGRRALLTNKPFRNTWQR